MSGTETATITATMTEAATTAMMRVLRVPDSGLALAALTARSPDL